MLFEFNKENRKLKKKINQIIKIYKTLKDVPNKGIRNGLRHNREIFFYIANYMIIVERVEKVVLTKEDLSALLLLLDGKVLSVDPYMHRNYISFGYILYQAILGKKVHLVSNSELALIRDFSSLKQMLVFTDKSIGIILNNTVKRATNYECDIVFILAEQLVFDYLNCTTTGKNYIGKLDCLFIDDIDELLIDKSLKGYTVVEKVNEKLVDTLKNMIETMSVFSNNIDFIEDEMLGQTMLTKTGYNKVYDCVEYNFLQNNRLIISHYIYLLLKVKSNFVNGRDYIVENNEIVFKSSITKVSDSKNIVFLLRLLEGLEVNAREYILSSISFTSLFNKYRSINGISNSSQYVKDILKELYNLEVSSIATKYGYGERLQDVIVSNNKYKMELIIEEILKLRKEKTPIIFYTDSINEAKHMEELLKEKKIGNKLILNAGEYEEYRMINTMLKSNSVVIVYSANKVSLKLKAIDEKQNDIRILFSINRETYRKEIKNINRFLSVSAFCIYNFYISLDNDMFTDIMTKIDRKLLNEYATSNIEFEDVKLTKEITHYQSKQTESVNFRLLEYKAFLKELDNYKLGIESVREKIIDSKKDSLKFSTLYVEVLYRYLYKILCKFSDDDGYIYYNKRLNHSILNSINLYSSVMLCPTGNYTLVECTNRVKSSLIKETNMIFSQFDINVDEAVIDLLLFVADTKRKEFNSVLYENMNKFIGMQNLSSVELSRELREYYSVFKDELFDEFIELWYHNFLPQLQSEHSTPRNIDNDFPQ
ncbi:MAG: hypothetical protein ACRC41_01460 [Sarcina sp.]